MPLVIHSTLEIPDGDLQLQFIRASGPGGQNVNKVASAVQLRFDLVGTRALNERVKNRLKTLAGRRFTDEGSILILARQHRTQEQNKRDALDRLAQLIRAALVEPKTRRATRPTRASKERRLQNKRVTKERKKGRSRSDWDS